VIVSYIRVSTNKQGQSGLGLEGQRVANARFAEMHGLEILTTFVDIETAKGADVREQILSAVPSRHRSKALPGRARFGLVHRSKNTSKCNCTMLVRKMPSGREVLSGAAPNHRRARWNCSLVISIAPVT
jgi:hypothetical protein